MMVPRGALACALLFAGGVLFAASPWETAVDLYHASEGLVPGRMSVRFDQYNGHDDLVSSDEREIEVWLDENGELANRVISARKDGEPVDPQTLADRDGGSSGDRNASPFGDGSAFAGLQISPFDPAQQSNVTITSVGPIERIDGVDVRAYSFVHRVDHSTNRGTAWLDASSGAPVRLVLTIDPLPAFVTALSMRQEFTRDANGNLVVSSVDFSASGALLFFKRRLESRMVFSEYFRSD